MKLESLFLKEDTKFVLSDFIQEVKPFLDECMKGGKVTNGMLWHGPTYTSYMVSSIGKFNFTLRDKARDSSREAFTAANKFTKEKFGIEPRRWLFTTSAKREAATYGSPMLTFPIGEFEYFFIKDIQDFQVYMSELIGDLRADDQEVNVFDLVYNTYSAALRNGQLRHNKDLPLALKGGFEVMLNGGQFYMVDPTWFRRQLKKQFTDNKLMPYYEWLCDQFGIEL